jgi:hypothetical protein
MVRTAGIVLIALPTTVALAQGTLRIGIQNPPEVLNPVLPIELDDLTITGSLFAPITVVNPETLSTEPYLAREPTSGVRPGLARQTQG